MSKRRTCLNCGKMRVRRPKKLVSIKLSKSQKERLKELVITVYDTCRDIVGEAIERSGFHKVTLSCARAMIFKMILNFIMSLIDYTHKMDAMAMVLIKEEIERK